MSWSKIISANLLIFFIFGIATVDNAIAGEKVKQKWHGISYSTKFEQIDVGDEEGHIIAIYENKSIYVNEATGERAVDRGSGILDINMKTGIGSVRGYGELTYENGDKMYRYSEGKPVAKGISKGVWKITKCTGTLEGTKGGGTWTSYNMAPKQSFVEVEGEMETP